MSDELRQKLKALAEQFRDLAAAVEVRHGKEQWAQTVNIIHAYESCAEEVESLLKLEKELEPLEMVNAS